MATSISTRKKTESHIEVYEVTKIKRNPRGGRPMRDMWGCKVWEEPMYIIESKSLKDGHKSGVNVQSENSDLSWLEWVDSENQMRKSIYEHRKRMYLLNILDCIKKLDKESSKFPLYLDCMDEPMWKLLIKIEELTKLTNSITKNMK